MLCTVVTRNRWPKGVLGLRVGGGGTNLKINLITRYLAFEGQNFVNCGTVICSTLQQKCLAKGTVIFNCKLIETALGVTALKRGVGAENACFKN